LNDDRSNYTSGNLEIYVNQDNKGQPQQGGQNNQQQGQQPGKNPGQQTQQPSEKPGQGSDKS